ncbi:MAG: polysaccharide lyase [Nitrospirales bacterium]
MSNAAVAHDSGTVPTFLRVTYPAGSVGEGTEWKAKPFTPRESIHLRYQVRFPTDFDFVRGGKLPGLYGGTGNSGGNIPDGTDGWSTRLMWRTGGQGEVYAYLPTSETWGTRLGTGSWNFTADGKWHTVEQKVILNTPGSKNGEVTIWYDGVKVMRATGLTFRTTDTLKVDGVFFSTFFGGNDATWATPRTVHADFANFAVATGYIGP